MSIMDETERMLNVAANLIRGEGIKSFVQGVGQKPMDGLIVWMQKRVPGYSPDWYEHLAKEAVERSKSTN